MLSFRSPPKQRTDAAVRTRTKFFQYPRQPNLTLNVLPLRSTVKMRSLTLRCTFRALARTDERPLGDFGSGSAVFIVASFLCDLKEAAAL